ncbi:sterile alpha motif domain-containing protein 9-like [Actinia tenebrosa]|uniref:Sterile alpha motif domain-containing protein 9-like n=1 Tax=Actinia tenebrosa TaxID=6105 RepID=A0A6P8GYS5_ACTTE|nr:sterile alpha motif domain-containing protein 9-like [Actinia tenebrosa]
MILSEEHELVAFNNGDINKWDVSLITKVLLYSKKCKEVISKRLGFKRAICCIKRYKDKLVSHACDEKMSDADYQVHWPAISGHLETIGASKEEIDTILKENGKVYHDQLSSRHDYPNWDEWMKFRNNVRNFDHFQNNYILMTDAIPPDLMEHFSIFRSVPWKMVLDFDPSSEEKGMYQDFSSKDGKNSLINMITPAEIRCKSIANLARDIDANKTQWMFVNGRENDRSDGGPQGFEDWEDNAVGDISTFFRCCSEPDKLDKNKPLVCLVLPFREETVPFMDMTVKRLLENFKEFDLKFIGITPKDQPCALPERMLKKINIHTTDLEPQLLCLGMEDLFKISSEQSYCMPTSQANMPAKLTQTDCLYLKEYLDVLYEGCEDLPNMIDVGEDGQKPEDLIEEHKKSFMSGNCISFVSLYYSHDAKREIGNEIRTHIQRLLDQGLTHSTIVEISHSPGSGGSTIARRVMWDIHKSYPCAIAKLGDHKFDLEDDNVFLDNLVDRINAVQEICHTTPVVLLDGKHTRIEALSNRLVRILNSRGKRAVLLRCNHNLEKSKARSSTLESSDVHATFSVNVRLEESKADLKEFESKYKDYIKECKNIRSLSGLSRVFHFPLFAMLEEFRNKLQEIIYESFDEMTDIEKEIVTVVAFIQRFAAQAIPAPLLYTIFQQSIQAHQSSTFPRDLQGVTYEDIGSTIMTERLWNLMVPANPAKSICLGRRFKRENYFQEMYTLQHPVVAEMVLQKAKIALKRDTLALARDFLGFPIFDDIRFMPLMKDLFVLNGCGQGKFSVLFEELKVMNPHEAGDVFCEAAEKTKDLVVVTSAARFYAKVPPQSFSKAKELIEKAFECANAEEKQKTIYDVKGVVLLKELKSLAKSEKIASLEHLQQLAQTVIESFKSARTFPPSFPNPLIGEVRTWVTCIEWITKNIFNGSSIMALHFITSFNAPPFFQTCVSDSFHLLDVVDYIVKSVRTLSNPEKTHKEANNVRLSLMKALNCQEGRNASEIIRECKALCSAEIFRSSSQMELKRLRVQYVFSCVKEIESIDKRGLEYLLKLLKDLVEVGKDEIFANHLMRICVLITGPQQYSLDQGLAVCKIWNQKSKYEALPHFYEMMIYFLKILDGNEMEFRSRYLNALEKCREKSYHDCRNTMSTHFLGKTGTGMSRLMTINTLFRGTTDNKPVHDAAYWKTGSRERLMECCGRIRSRSSGTNKTFLTVELMPGIELYIAKSAGIGIADRHFVPGSMVYFVVSFNLRGPVANGINFKSSLMLLSRQQSFGNS